jgi:hypothetical protein
MQATHRHGHFVEEHRDDLVLILLGLVLLVTFLADAAGWFRSGLFFRG